LEIRCHGQPFQLLRGLLRLGRHGTSLRFDAAHIAAARELCTLDCGAVRTRARVASLIAGITLVAIPLSAQADGVAWGIVPSPNSSTSQRNVLYDVSCAGVNDCWAVGWHGSTTGN